MLVATFIYSLWSSHIQMLVADSHFETNCYDFTDSKNMDINCMYEGHLESKERFAIKKYLLIIRGLEL